MKHKTRMIGRLSALLVFLLMVGLVTGISVYAQADPSGEPVPDVTDDEVNAIAKQLFCPVCENIPLDTCGTAACSDWRYEIRLQLEANASEQEIIDDFVYRFGDRVVGTPRSTIPRLLSLVTPWIAIAAGLYFGLRFLMNNRQKTALAVSSDDRSADSSYRDLLEQDVSG